jgi:hypothetical protein
MNDRRAAADEHTLEYLLAFDGRVHYLEQGYWLKFEIRRVRPTSERPHGLQYAFTLHSPEGKRLVGFDNAHRVPRKSSHARNTVQTYDHWHRAEDDEGRPYRFTTADQILADFFAEVQRVLASRGVADTVISDGETKDRRKQP